MIVISSTKTTQNEFQTVTAHIKRNPFLLFGMCAHDMETIDQQIIIIIRTDAFASYPMPMCSLRTILCTIYSIKLNNVCWRGFTKITNIHSTPCNKRHKVRRGEFVAFCSLQLTVRKCRFDATFERIIKFTDKTEERRGKSSHMRTKCENCVCTDLMKNMYSMGLIHTNTI